MEEQIYLDRYKIRIWRLKRFIWNIFYKISIHDFKAETKPVVKDARTNLLDEIAKGKQLKVKDSKLLNNFQFIIF